MTPQSTYYPFHSFTSQGKGGRKQILKFAPSMEPIDLVSNEFKFFVDVRDIHHHLDFKFVRLVLQVTETMKVLMEQRKYAQNNKDSVTSDKGKYCCILVLKIVVLISGCLRIFEWTCSGTELVKRCCWIRPSYSSVRNAHT